MKTTTTTKRLLDLARLSATIDPAAGPFTFVVRGDLPRFAASPNLTALVLSRATAAPVVVLGPDGREVARVDHEALDAAERERRLLGERQGSNRRGREVPLTQAQERMAALLKRPEGATRDELCAAAGKKLSPWATAQKLGQRLGLVAARDRNATPERHWLKEAEATPAPKAEPKRATAKAAA